MCKPVIAAFDFDGTLTTRDTLPAFIRFTHGCHRLLAGLLRHAHWLLLMRLGLCPNWKAKEKLFSYYYKGTTHAQFQQWGRDFADVAATMLDPQTAATLRQHQAAGHAVCVVTASVDEWVRPLCERLGVSMVMATRIEVSPDATLTGRFLTRNCNGAEKVARLLETFPHRQSYRLYAYGDSHGDDELIASADVGVRILRSKTMIFRCVNSLCTEIFGSLSEKRLFCSQK